jgi:hypothetical protein
MLNVSKPALVRLSHKLARDDCEDDVALRFTPHENGWKLIRDRARSGDATFAHDGRNVLVLDLAVSQAMADLALDLRRTEAGPRLRLRRQGPQDK